MLDICFSACAGSVEEPAKSISEDYGDPVSSGFSSAGSLQVVVSHWGAHDCISDPVAKPWSGCIAVQRRPQPAGIC